MSNMTPPAALVASTMTRASPAPTGRVIGIATPVEVSQWVSA